MAELTAGIDNNVVGKVGNHVVRRVNGKNIISIAPGKRTKPPTPKQVVQTEKMGTFFTMMNKIVGILNVGFSLSTTKMSAVNAAVKYNYKFLVPEIGGGFVLDYPHFMFSRGRVAEPEAAVVTAAAGAKLTAGWGAGLHDDDAEPDDKAYFLVYNPTLDKFARAVNTVPRSALTYNIQLPASFSGDDVHVYMCFVSKLGKPGNSVYLGEITVL